MDVTGPGNVVLDWACTCGTFYTFNNARTFQEQPLAYLHFLLVQESGLVGEVDF